MWKTLFPGEKVHPGDSIRYRSHLSYFKAYLGKVYQVMRADQHYFEMASGDDPATSPEQDIRVIKYMDVSYHITLEIWSGSEPFRAQSDDGPVKKIKT